VHTHSPITSTTTTAIAQVEEKFGAREEGSVPDANAETELEDKKRKFIDNELAATTTFVVAFRSRFGVGCTPRVKLGKMSSTHRGGKGGCSECADLIQKLSKRGLCPLARKAVQDALTAHWVYVREQR